MLREPWRFGEQNRTPEQVGMVKGFKRTTPYENPDATNGKQTAQASVAARVNKALQAKAADLGLPIADYHNTLTMAVRFMDGGRQQFLAFVGLAAADADEDAQRFLACYADLRVHEQSRASFDMICVAAGVSPVQLLKSVVGIAFDAGVEVANLVAAAAHPAIVSAAVQSAKRTNSEIGFRDREMLMRHHGFVPIPKGTTVNVTASATAQAAAAAGSREPSVPSFMADAEASAIPRRTVQHDLLELPPAGSDDPFADLRRTTAVDAELVER